MLLCGIIEAIIITVWAWLGIIDQPFANILYESLANMANDALGCSIVT